MLKQKKQIQVIIEKIINLITKIEFNMIMIKKYTLALIINSKLTNNQMKYTEGIFYNDVVNGIEFIKSFVKIIKNDERYTDTINLIEMSDDIIAFKITNIMIDNIKYLPPNQLTKRLMNSEKIGINSKYTNYIANLKASSFKDLLQFEYNDYIKKNYRPKSCFLTTIINRCYDRFNRKDSKGYRKNKELTYSFLCSLFEIDNSPSHNAVSVKDVKDKFLSKFNFVSLFVYDCYMNLIFEHKATDK